MSTTYYLNQKTLTQWQDIGKGRCRYHVGTLSVSVYDMDFTHAQSFDAVASILQTAINAAIVAPLDPIFVTVTYEEMDDGTSRFVLEADTDDLPFLAFTSQRVDEEPHVCVWRMLCSMETWPTTAGLSPEVYNDGNWDTQIALSNFDTHLSAGVKRFILGWVFGADLAGYNAGHYPASVGGGTIGCNPVGPRQLELMGSPAVSTFVASWASFVDQVNGVGGEVIAYIGAVALTYTPSSNYVEWCQEVLDAGMSVMLDAQGAIDVTQDTPNKNVLLCDELLALNVPTYQEPHDLNLPTEYGYWQDPEFGALSSISRAELMHADTTNTWFHGSDDKMVWLVPDLDTTAEDVIRAKLWIKRGWVATLLWYLLSEEQWADLATYSWDTDLFFESYLSIILETGGPTIGGVDPGGQIDPGIQGGGSEIVTGGLPIVVITEPFQTVYAIVSTSDMGLTFNPGTGALESLGSATDCADGVEHAIDCEEMECLPGVYVGRAAITVEGTYIVIAYTQQESEPNLQVDEQVNSTQVDWDGAEEITFIDIDGSLTDIQNAINVLSTLGSGGLTPFQNRMLTELFQRKANNRPN